jgi:hypothetical protein
MFKPFVILGCMSATEFLSGLQHGDENAAYSYKGVAGPETQKFEGPSLGDPSKQTVGEGTATGQSSREPLGDLAQV